jgi:hypothetical protein
MRERGGSAIRVEGPRDLAMCAPFDLELIEDVFGTERPTVVAVERQLGELFAEVGRGERRWFVVYNDEGSATGVAARRGRCASAPCSPRRAGTGERSGAGLEGRPSRAGASTRLRGASRDRSRHTPVQASGRGVIPPSSTDDAATCDEMVLSRASSLLEAQVDHLGPRRLVARHCPPRAPGLELPGELADDPIRRPRSPAPGPRRAPPRRRPPVGPNPGPNPRFLGVIGRLCLTGPSDSSRNGEV